MAAMETWAANEIGGRLGQSKRSWWVFSRWFRFRRAPVIGRYSRLWLHCKLPSEDFFGGHDAESLAIDLGYGLNNRPNGIW